MAYIIRVNGIIVGKEILTPEEIKKINKNFEISLEKA